MGCNMADDETSARSVEAKQATCEKCGGDRLEHLTRLPKGMGHPTFDIFRCVACGFVNWFAREDG
jgi:DNA-directed RNA polymerase subunit M/transcription elongation factor TFIIS